eukprot:TRINITY_DN22672_c0_g1_i1.p1 TRINITY_DN22672_c0_g1~~TRINITY_DN22672_c0_g1_i1.p1  ORF type:complete len:610 (-),score=174.31 TRINITY_DN22672_c0_g1_i1:423-2252(-)
MPLPEEETAALRAENVKLEMMLKEEREQRAADQQRIKERTRDTFQKMKESAKTEQQALQEELDRVTLELSNQKVSTQESAQAEQEALREELGREQLELSSMAASSDTAMQGSESLRVELEQLRTSHHLESQHAASAEAMIMQHKEEVEQIRSSEGKAKRKAEEALEETRASSQALQIKFDKLKSGMRPQFERMQSALDAEAARANQAEEVSKQYQEEADALRCKFDTLQSEMRPMFERMQSDIDAQAKRADAAEAASKRYREEADQLRLDGSEAAQQAETSIQELQKVVSRHREADSVKRAEAEALQLIHIELDTARAENELMRKSLEKLKSELRSKDAADTEVDRQEMSSLRSENNTLQKEVVHLRVASVAADERAATAEALVATITEQTKQLRAADYQVQQQLNSKVAQLEADLERAAETLLQARAENFKHEAQAKLQNPCNAEAMSPDASMSSHTFQPEETLLNVEKQTSRTRLSRDSKSEDDIEIETSNVVQAKTLRLRVKELEALVARADDDSAALRAQLARAEQLQEHAFQVRDRLSFPGRDGGKFKVLLDWVKSTANQILLCLRPKQGYEPIELDEAECLNIGEWPSKVGKAEYPHELDEST